jgi:hypothetical protein
MLRGSLVTTAWHILRLHTEKMALDMKVAVNIFSKQSWIAVRGGSPD